MILNVTLVSISVYVIFLIDIESIAWDLLESRFMDVPEVTQTAIPLLMVSIMEL
jgi:hypothetical protein